MPVTIALYVTASVIMMTMFIMNGTTGSDAAIVVRKKISWKTFSRCLFVCLFLFVYLLFFFHRSFFILWIYLQFSRFFGFLLHPEIT